MSVRDSQPEVTSVVETSDLQPDDGEVTLALIEARKKEVDFYIRTDAQEASQRAEALYLLSMRSADPLARALGVRARAQSLHVLGRHAEAIAAYEQARELYQVNAKPVEAARVARALVDALMYQGKYEQALALAEDSRQVFETHSETLLGAQLETNVGNIYHRLDRYQEALGCYERARQAFAALNDETALATVAYNAANIHSSLDNFREAHTLYQQAYDLFQSQGMELSAVQSRYAIGYLLFLTGDFHQAVRILYEVRDASDRLGDQLGMALCDLDLAEIYLQLHVLGEAATRARQARERFQALNMRFESAKALTLLGLTCLQQKNLSDAEPMLREAEQEFIKEGNEVHQGLVCLYLAELALKRQQLTESRELAARAEQVFIRQQLMAKTCYAQLVTARAWLIAGDNGQARALAETVLEKSRRLEAPWLKYQAQELLGDALLAAGETVRAYEEYAQAVTYIEQMRSGIRVDEYRSAFFKDKLRVYEKLIQLCLGQENAQGEAAAFFYLESSKARTLVDLLVNQLEGPAAVHEGLSADLVRHWRQLREELNWFYNKASQEGTTPSSRRLIMAPQVWTEIETRERALADVVRHLQIHDPQFIWLNNVKGLTVEELCSALSADEAVIEYYVADDELRIFVIDQSGLRVVHATVSRQQLKEQVLKLKLQLEKFQFGPKYVVRHGESLLSSINGCLRELHRLLFAPVAPLVANKKLIFIPFDLLHAVPFQALFNGECYLVELHEIASAPSARLLTLFAAEPSEPGQNALIFGAADEFTPHINQEITAIRALYPDAVCFNGAAATAQALQQHAPGKEIVHIASHAVFRHDNPMFSAFHLADAWLNLYDVSSLDLRSSLVTLSGCSTGANEINAGDELLGLVRGFLAAGARALVVSLWEVSDEVTAQLMTAFYQQLQLGRPVQTALRTAALEIKRTHPHPYYWAPFMFIGRAGSGSLIPGPAMEDWTGRV